MRPASPPRRLLGATLTAVLLAAIALPPLAGAAAKAVHVGTARNAHLHRTVLVTAHGRTLYSLSAEAHGRFICTGSCVSTWKPLLVPGGAKLTGPKGLKVVKRPDGRRQAAYRGRPLYTFSGDAQKGDANGEGFRDVGVWHAASPPKPKAAQPPAPAPAPAPANPMY
jgi:predicted lipoprotein with Yx(FWY)xxD motif